MMAEHRKVQICCTIFLLLLSAAHGVYEAEMKLHEQLFDKYKTNVIPREFRGGPVIVNFDLSLQSLNSFDVKSQVLSCLAITMLKWKDERLTWEKIKYPDIETISVEPKTIWTPDVVLYNTAQVKSASHIDIYKTRPIISRDGWVIWNAPVTWEVSCSSDVTWFPIDEQTCELFFGSWSYDDFHLMLWRFENISGVDTFYSSKSRLGYDFSHIDISKSGTICYAFLVSEVFSVENGEWHISDIHSEERLVSFECCKNPFSSIVYIIKLERLSSFYFIYIIIPLMTLAFLFLFVFHIPFDSGERTGFGVTVLLSITVYLLVISEKLPEKSDTSPVLGTCFIFVMFLLCIALVVAIVLMHTPHFKTKPPKFFIWFAQLGNQTFMRLTNCILRRNKDTGKKKHKKSDKEIENELLETNNIVVEKVVQEEVDYQHEWKIASRQIEKKLFIIFAVLLLIVPMLIILVFPKKGRA